MNRKKFNIGLDLDGVIIDHTQNKIKVAKSFGFRVTAKKIQSEALKGILPEKEYKKLQRVIYNKMTLDAPPTPLALGILQKLSQNYKFFIISRRRKDNLNMVWCWFEKYKIFKIIPKRNIIFVEKDGDKNFWCKKLKIKVYLDDKVKVLDLLSFVPWRIFFNPHKVLHNKKYLEIKSWKEFSKLVDKLKEKEKTWKPKSSAIKK